MFFSHAGIEIELACREGLRATAAAAQPLSLQRA